MQVMVGCCQPTATKARNRCHSEGTRKKVLFVAAAGNDGQNNDLINDFHS